MPKPKRRRQPKAELIGVAWPDDGEIVINDAPCAAVVVHKLAHFNNAALPGAIQVCGCLDGDVPLDGVLDAMDDGPDWLDAAGARRLAALLLKAADRADEIARG